MRFFKSLAISGLLLGFIAAPAQASTWLDWPWNWPLWDWSDDDETFQPYLHGPKIYHHDRWEHDDWKPEDWIAAKGSQQAVMDGLYKAQIITGQTTKGGVPVLEVGQDFVMLSGQEKRRVVMFVDHVYNITGSTPQGMFYLYHAAADEPIGSYTKEGLQLQ